MQESPLTTCNSQSSALSAAACCLDSSHSSSAQEYVISKIMETLSFVQNLLYTYVFCIMVTSLMFLALSLSLSLPPIMCAQVSELPPSKTSLSPSRSTSTLPSNTATVTLREKGLKTVTSGSAINEEHKMSSAGDKVITLFSSLSSL